MAGKRTVPVELGSKYSDDNWSQKLMTISDFIHKHILVDGQKSNARVTHSDSTNTVAIGYLAQHPLFDQVTFSHKNFT